MNIEESRHIYIENVELFKRKVDLTDYKFPIGEVEAYGPESFGQLAKLLIGRAAQEKFIVCMYDDNGVIVGYSEINKGTSRMVTVDVFSALRTAIVSGSQRLALAHNHPSGDTTPSAQDMETTINFIKAAKCMDIEVMDHLVVSDDKWTSIRNHVGELKWEAAVKLL